MAHVPKETEAFKAAALWQRNGSGGSSDSYSSGTGWGSDTHFKIHQQ